MEDQSEISQTDKSTTEDQPKINPPGITTMEDQSEISAPDKSTMEYHTEISPAGLTTMENQSDISPPDKTTMEFQTGISPSDSTERKQLNETMETSTLEPIKEELETTSPEVNEEVQSIQTVKKVQEQTMCMSKLGMMDNGELIRNAETAKTTDDESDSKPKEHKRARRKRSRPLKRSRKRKMTKITVIPENRDREEKEMSVDKEIETSTDISKDDIEYCLTVSNLPNSWSFMDIKNYIDTECGPVDEIEMIKDDKTGNGAIRLSYQTEAECKDSMEKLKNKKIDGNKLSLEMNVVSCQSEPETPEVPEVPKKPWKPDLDSWEVDLHGMYGLKLPFLRSLGITPPLDKWVHVSNFLCDKLELRDVMEMAGNVLMCSVYTLHPRYANVMFSHPLEAVQAVSMLNNQMFYGHKLKVVMDRSPSNTVVLPKGLTNIGKGLGMYGKPLRNIVKHYERFVDNQDSLINTAFFDIPANHSMKLSEGFDSKFQVKCVDDFNYPIVSAKEAGKAVTTNATGTTSTSTIPTIVKTPKPTVQTPAYSVAKPTLAATPPRPNFTPVQNFPRPQMNNTNFRMPFSGPAMNGQGPHPGMPLMQGPRPGPPGPFIRPGFQGPMPRPGWGPGPGPMNGPSPGPMAPGMGPAGPMGPGPMGLRPMGPAGPVGSPGTMGLRPMGPAGPVGSPGTMGPMGPQGAFPNPNEPVKLALSNLPPNTTFPLLCEKMSEWGHMVSIQLTTPGCAVVTFANRMQADACLQYYNGRKIDNCYIQVSYA